MVSTELRIGNFVKTKINTIDVFKLTSIGYDYVLLTDEYNDYDSLIEELNPIPLTEEWLLKFGFENKPDIDNGTYHTTVFEKDGVALLFFMGNFDECSINGDLEFDFTYVHTLQNFWHLFRKQELKIK